MKKKSLFKINICILSITVFVILLGMAQIIPATATGTPPVIDAENSSIIDSKSGAIIYSRDGETKKNPGDLTKMMTAIIAVESGDMTDVQKSQIKKMISENDNEASESLAKSVSADIGAFYTKMNEKAKLLGCEGTNFNSVSGKTESEDHYSTSDDMALIAREFANNTTLRDMLDSEKKDKISYETMISSGENDKSRYMAMVGVKEETEFISVTIGGATKEGNIEDNRSLLKFAFDNFRTYQALSKDKSAGKIKIKGGQKSYVKVYPKKDLYVTLPKEGADSLVKTEAILTEDIKAPVKKGDVVGKIQAVEAGEITGEVEAIVREDVGQGGPWSKIGISDYMMVTIAIVAIALLTLIIVVKSRKKKKRKRLEEKRRRRREAEAIRIAQERAEKKKRDWPY